MLNSVQLSNYIITHKERFLQELIDFLRIPSVSTDPQYREDVREAAEWLASHMKHIGIENVSIHPTRGHPIVIGEKIVDPALPTVLVYGHYDVQPPDPYDLWESPPFQPVIREEKIYARGAADDKGQLFIHLKAFEWMNSVRYFPCNIKFIFEGEEEIGSPHLPPFLTHHAERLSCDAVLISDTSLLSMEHPSVTIGLRGLSYFEVEFQGPTHDLHSGVYGGALPNPANALARFIAGLHADNGRITIERLYDAVLPPEPEEFEVIEFMRRYDDRLKQETGVRELTGEKGYSAYEQTALRPSLDVNGMWSGYQGEGSKTIIPASAHAKFSIRLVPDQRTDEVNQLVKKHLEKHTPPGIKATLKILHGGDPYLLSVHSPEYRAAAAAIEDVFGKKPLPLRTGGSIPIVTHLRKTLDAQAVLLGFGLDSDAIHSPNEHFGIKNFLTGIETIPHFYRHYARFCCT